MNSKKLILAASGVLFAGFAAAQSETQSEQTVADGLIYAELNKLEQVDAACRFYLLFRSDAFETMTRAGLDLVLFDADGGIIQRLRYEAAPLVPEKTVVKLF